MFDSTKLREGCRKISEGTKRNIDQIVNEHKGRFDAVQEVKVLANKNPQRLSTDLDKLSDLARHNYDEAMLAPEKPEDKSVEYLKAKAEFFREAADIAKRDKKIFKSWLKLGTMPLEVNVYFLKIIFAYVLAKTLLRVFDRQAIAEK